MCNMTKVVQEECLDSHAVTPVNSHWRSLLELKCSLASGGSKIRLNVHNDCITFTIRRGTYVLIDCTFCCSASLLPTDDPVLSASLTRAFERALVPFEAAGMRFNTSSLSSYCTAVKLCCEWIAHSRLELSRSHNWKSSGISECCSLEERGLMWRYQWCRRSTGLSRWRISLAVKLLVYKITYVCSITADRPQHFIVTS